jgi:tetrahydrodipicolinate N-succinyltransferase
MQGEHGASERPERVLHVDPGFPPIVGEDCVVGHNAIVHGSEIENACLVSMGTTKTKCSTLKFKEKGGALSDLAFGPHSATVPVNDALHRGQSYPRTLVLAHAVQALESTE